MDFLKCVNERYHATRPEAATWHWRADVPFAALPAGRALIIEDRSPFTLHFGVDDWTKPTDRTAEPLGLGMFGVRFDTAELAGHQALVFTRRYGSDWEGKDWRVEIES
jgi:glucoamylase